MRFMFLARPQLALPPEMVPQIVEGFASWWDRYRDRWETGGFFAGGGGGVAICNVADEVEFHRMILEWPLTPYTQIETRALVDVDAALTQWREVLAGMAMGQEGR